MSYAALRTFLSALTLVLLNMYNTPINSIFFTAMVSYSNFDGPQIQVTAGGFVQRTPYVQCSYQTHCII